MLQSPHFIYRTERGAAGQPLTGLRGRVEAVVPAAQHDARQRAARRREGGQPEHAPTASPRRRRRCWTRCRRAPCSSASTPSCSGSIATRTSRRTRRSSPGSTPPWPRICAPLTSSCSTTSTRRASAFKDLLLTPVAFVNQNTAPLYGMTATGTTFKQVMLGADRPGYFTRAGFLAYNGTLRRPGSDSPRRRHHPPRDRRRGLRAARRRR